MGQKLDMQSTNCSINAIKDIKMKCTLYLPTSEFNCDLVEVSCGPWSINYGHICIILANIIKESIKSDLRKMKKKLIKLTANQNK